MRLKIDLKIFIFLILFYFTRQIKEYSVMMLFCIIHEFGHLLSGIILGMKPISFEIMPFGFRISFKLKTDDFNRKIKKGNLLELKKIFVALSGPVINLIIIILTLLLNEFYDKQIIIYANTLIVLFNLLPIYPLDGGRIFKSIVHIFWGAKASKKITNMVANIMIIVITVIGSITVYYFKNIAIFLVIVFLWGIVVQENKKYKIIIKAYSIIQGGEVHE